MGKVKKERRDENADDSMMNNSQLSEKSEYDEKLKFVSAIARPMANRKLTKKIFKLIKKASKHKNYLRNGLKSVQGWIRKGEHGLVFMAGDVTPIDIMCHLPGVCEDLNIPYVYVPAKKDIGTAMGVKRNVLTVMVLNNDDYTELYNECSTIMQESHAP